MIALATPLTWGAPAGNAAGTSVSTNSSPESAAQWSLLFGYWNWTEKLSLEKNGVTASDWANIQTQALGVGWRKAQGHWGYGIDGFFLDGQASGGGNSAIAYQESRVNVTGFAANPYGLYRLDRFAEFGVELLALQKDLRWPVSDPSLSVSSKAGVLDTSLFFWNIRPTRDFMFHAGLGPAFDSQTTILTLHLTYFL